MPQLETEFEWHSQRPDDGEDGGTGPIGRWRPRTGPRIRNAGEAQAGRMRFGCAPDELLGSGYPGQCLVRGLRTDPGKTQRCGLQGSDQLWGSDFTWETHFEGAGFKNGLMRCGRRTGGCPSQFGFHGSVHFDCARFPQWARFDKVAFNDAKHCPEATFGSGPPRRVGARFDNSRLRT